MVFEEGKQSSTGTPMGISWVFSCPIGLGESVEVQYNGSMPKGVKGFQKGHKEFRVFFGKGRKQSEKERLAHRTAALKFGVGKWMLGKKMSEESKNKRRGANNKNWKGGKFLDKNGYVLKLCTGHPKAIRGGYVLEHRLVMEERLGRHLLTHENVHHINGDRADNRITNLELWSSSQPPGQRVEDKVRWAKELLELYEGERKI